MLAKAKAKATETVDGVASAATGLDEKMGLSAKLELVSELAKKEAKDFDERHGVSEKAEAARAAAVAKAAELDESYQVSERAAAARAAAAAKAAELDEKHQVSERAAELRAAAAAKAVELDEKHQVSERAAELRAAAAAKATQLDQKLGEKITIDGYVGHTSTLQFDLKADAGLGKQSIDEWIAWSETKSGLPLTKSARGCCALQLYKSDTGLFLFEEWDQISSQMHYLEQRRFPGEPSAEIAVVEVPEPLATSPPPLPFNPPEIKMLTDLVDWPVAATTAAKTAPPGLTICRTLSACSAAKYEELLAWSQSEEDGLAFTAAQPGILKLKSWKIDSTQSMFLWEQWASPAQEEAYMTTRSEQGLEPRLIKDGVLTAPPVVLVLEHIATYANESASECAEPQQNLEDKTLITESAQPKVSAEAAETVLVPAANSTQGVTTVKSSAEEGVPPVEAVERAPELATEPALEPAPELAPEPASVLVADTELEPEAEPTGDSTASAVAAAAAASIPELLCEGRVQLQFSGKGDFVPVWLSLGRDGSIVCRSVSVYMNGELVHGGAEGRVQRTASAVGCDIKEPKTARRMFDAKARKYNEVVSFRLDLAQADSKGDNKYIVYVSEEDGRLSGTTLATLREQLTLAAKADLEDLESRALDVDASEILCEGRVLVQAGGKGDFVPRWLSVHRDGGLTFSVAPTGGGDVQQPGALVRSTSAKGAAISKPKSIRKGFEDAFRIDLVCDEGKGTDLPGLKFIVAIDRKDVEAGGKALKDWKGVLKRVV